MKTLTITQSITLVLTEGTYSKLQKAKAIQSQLGAIYGGVRLRDFQVGEGEYDYGAYEYAYACACRQAAPLYSELERLAEVLPGLI